MKKKVYMILFVICIAVLGVSGWKLWDIFHTYQEGDALYEDVTKEVVSASDETAVVLERTDPPEDVEPEEKKQTDPMISVDFKKLKEKNEDVVGWLYIPNSAISYPLVQGTDNNRYLHETYDKQSSIFGSIFMDYRNSSDLSDNHTIINGHNMRNGSMFGGLKQYQDESFFRKHRNIYILTEDGTYRYRVFSCHVADATGRVYYVSEYEQKKAYQEYLNMVTQSSYFATKCQPKKKDRTITLSTCTGNDETRFVVHGMYMGTVSAEK